MNTRLKTIIVEDEQLAREGLLAYAREVQFIEIVSVFENALLANQLLCQEPIDLMFLDVQMPKLSGIDFLRALANPPMVILTTAYPNFALLGYELNLVDYLVKPFPFERFLLAANKARDLYSLKHKEGTSDRIAHGFFFIKCEGRYEKITFSDVQYVEGMENYIIVHTANKSFVTLQRMKTIEEILPASIFVRIHKSFIVSIQAIATIDGSEIVIHGKSTRLPISREKKADLLRKLTSV